MNSRMRLYLIVLGILFTVAFGACDDHPSGSARAVHVALLLDPSKSSVGGCECVVALAERALATPGLTSESTLTLLATGNEATANEPTLIAQHRAPKLRAVVEGVSAERKRKEGVLRDLRSQCEKLTPSNRSPIFYGVKRTIEHLRSLGCDNDSGCRLYVISDGEELVEQGVKQTINGQVSKSAAALPSRIPNEGIRIIFSGFAETSGALKNPDNNEQRLTPDRDPQRADRMREVWTGLFTATGQVNFEPFCPSVEGQKSARPR